MATEYASTAEAADPYCLRAGEAEALLAGHPWRRFVVLGDSVAAGVGDPMDGYASHGWTDRIAAELRVHRPDLAYVNLGQSDLRASEVRERQLEPARAFLPDLALVACGGNDALRPRYDAEAVDRELAAIISGLQSIGADVMTISLVAVSEYPAFPPWFRPVATERMRLLARHTNRVAAAYRTIHVDLSDHPIGSLPQEQLLSRDGLHANARSHAICAAEAIRSMGTRLGNSFTPKI